MSEHPNNDCVVLNSWCRRCACTTSLFSDQPFRSTICLGHRLCATPRGASAQVFTFAAHHADDDVSINEDDVTLILHNLRSTGSSGPSSKPTSRSTPSPLASPRSPVLLALPLRRSPTMTPAAARASSPSSRPVSPFHYLAKAAAAASTAHRLVQPQPRRQLPPLPSLRPPSPAAGALSSSSTSASSFFPSSSSASSLNTQHLTSLPSFPYSSSSTNTAHRAFFTSPRASSPPPPVHFTPSSSDTAARIHAFHHRQQQSLEPVYLPRYQEHAPPAYYHQQEARRPIGGHESAFDRLPVHDAFTAMLKQAGKHGFGVDQ